MKIHEPPMTFRDEAAAAQWRAGLDVNQDPYGLAVYRYASEWATRCEQALAAGESLEACWKWESRAADEEGITGFMYGCAVSILADVWRHGEALRRLHNLDCQIRDEGERANETGRVLNPALLRLG